MINDLKFVRGAVSRKNYQPALSHFRIKDGRVMGYNGTIALSSPIAIDLNATPKAVPFVKAIERCKETTSMHLTPGNKLSLKSGGFKALIECTDESEVLDSIQPEGVEIIFTEQLLKAFTALEPFIATDASRPWATGIFLNEQYAFATNNIIIAQYWIGSPVPTMNIPSSAIDELVRIGEQPISIRLAKNSATFFFAGDRWMRTQLLGEEFPVLSVEKILSNEPKEAMIPLPVGFFEAVEILVPFLAEEGRIYFRDGYISTSPEDGAGASQEIVGLPTRGAFNYEHLMKLNGIATAIDFTGHPLPCPFRGERLRGVILGMVDQ